MMRTCFKRAFVVACVVAIVGWSWYSYRGMASLKRENGELRKALETGIVANEDERSSPESVSTDSDREARRLAELAAENERLRRERAALERALENTEEDKEAMAGQLAELEAPFTEDIFSSTLRTTVGRDEVLVTGGYQTSDGQFQYTTVEPVIEQSANGQTVIRMRARMFSMTPEAVEAFGLNSLSTRAGNTLQHGELWTRAAYEQFMENTSEGDGIVTRSAPQMITMPGNEVRMWIGGFEIIATPSLSGEGSGVDLELRIEEPKDPRTAVPPNADL